MNILYSTYHFLESILIDSAFPTVFVIFIFALPSCRRMLMNKAFRFILVFFIITFIIRMSEYLATASNARYLYTLTLFFILVSAAGFTRLAEFAYKYARNNIHGVSSRHIVLFLLTAIAISCIGKALNSPDAKKYIKDIAGIIKASDREPVLLSGTGAGEMYRIAYHSGASRFYALNSLVAPDLKNLASAMACIEHEGLKPYLLVEQSDNDFKKQYDMNFQSFPLKLIREFHDRRDIFSLYESNLEKALAQYPEAQIQEPQHPIKNNHI